jgi:hypothetical protein
VSYCDTVKIEFKLKPKFLSNPKYDMNIRINSTDNLPELSWDQTAMGIPPFTRAVYLILVKCERLGEISKMSLLVLWG